MYLSSRRPLRRSGCRIFLQQFIQIPDAIDVIESPVLFREEIAIFERNDLARFKGALIRTTAEKLLVNCAGQAVEGAGVGIVAIPNAIYIFKKFHEMILGPVNAPGPSCLWHPPWLSWRSSVRCGPCPNGFGLS